MDIKLERALIRTYRKIRVNPKLLNSEIAGLFVNFYYAECGIHGGLDTRGFTIVRHDDIICIVMSTRSTWYEVSNTVYEELKNLTPADYYALYLRSSWEDPNNECYGEPATKCVISVAQYIKSFENAN